VNSLPPVVKKIPSTPLGGRPIADLNHFGQNPGMHLIINLQVASFNSGFTDTI
jgi:hypothetical protein